MHKIIPAVIGLLIVGWSSAYGAPPAKPGKGAPASLCKASETALFDCAMSDAASSICRNGGQVIFRYGYSWRKAELEVASNGRDGRARQYVAHIGGGPSGAGWSALQYTKRFVWRGLDFYSYVTDRGTQGSVSGLSIEKDDIALSTGTCTSVRHREFQIPNFVDKEKDEKHQIVY